MSFNIPLKIMYWKEEKRKYFWLHGDGLKQFPTMSPMEKHKKTMNKTSENMTYLIDNKMFLC